MHKADAKSSTGGLPFASKDLIRRDRDKDTAPAPFDGLVSPALETSEQLQAQSKDALVNKDWKSLEKLSLDRLEIVPDSIMAKKNLAQARSELGLAALAGRRFNEAERILLECLHFQVDNLGQTNEAVGITLLNLGKTSLGNANRKVAFERFSNAREILSKNGNTLGVEECDAELAKLK